MIKRTIKQWFCTNFQSKDCLKWCSAKKYCSIVLFIAISLQSIVIPLSFQIIVNIHTTLFFKELHQTYCQNNHLLWLYLFKLLPIFLQPFLLKELDQSYRQNNSLLLMGSIIFFLLLTIKPKTNWGDNYHLLEPHSPNNNQLLTQEASIGSFYLKLLLCPWRNH